CSSDKDCPGDERCCSTGCGRECRLPVGGDICDLPPVPGPCRGRFRHYAYNPAMGTCQPFTYSGCGGNPNNFKTVKECRQVC
ncbi:EPPI protein, partial [Pelecanoides urinatrix]|nr:EPPI protein [Pelecanoides urinatrix]